MQSYTVKAMLALLTIVMLAFFDHASANNHQANQCLFNGKPIALGDTIYIQDPVLIDAFSKQLSIAGLSPSAAKARASKSDWVGYVLKCSAVYTYNAEPNPDKAADVIQQIGVALIPLDHQEDWITNLKKEGIPSS